MTKTDIPSLRSMLASGTLFRTLADEHRIEAFIPPMDHESHAPNMVELPNGDLLCVWFSGSEEGRSDVHIVLSRLSSGETHWSAPMTVSDDGTRSEQNPMLFVAPDGNLWLFYTAQETRGCSKAEWSQRVAAGAAEGSYAMQWTALIRCCVSKDNGATWGPVETFSGKPSSFCRQPMIVLSNGDWLFPMYYSVRAQRHENDYSVVRISKDQGATWTEYPIPESRGRVHPSVLELAPGRLVTFLRSRAADRIYVSRSEDYGRTWTAPERTPLPNNNASIQAVKLASGHIAIIFNKVSSADDDATKSVWLPERYPVTVAISEDEGYTWPFMRHIDTSDDFCGTQNVHLNRRCEYPCMMQTRDGKLHLAYAYRDRQCIKYVQVTEEWVRHGYFTSDDPTYFTALFG